MGIIMYGNVVMLAHMLVALQEGMDLPQKSALRSAQFPF
jgi:hypothetical protein